MGAKQGKPGSGAGNQGEGDIEADRRYRERTQDFVESASGRQQIKQGVTVSEEEEKELERAEREGRSRAKEEDPNVDRDYERPRDDQDQARNKLL